MGFEMMGGMRSLLGRAGRCCEQGRAGWTQRCLALTWPGGQAYGVVALLFAQPQGLVSLLYAAAANIPDVYNVSWPLIY